MTKRSVAQLLAVVGVAVIAAVLGWAVIRPERTIAQTIGLDGEWHVVEVTEVEGTGAEPLDPALSQRYVFDTGAGTVRQIVAMRDGYPPAQLLDITFEYSETPAGDIRFQNASGSIDYAYSVSGSQLTLTRVAFTVPSDTPPAAPYESGGTPVPPAASAPTYRIVLQR